MWLACWYFKKQIMSSVLIAAPKYFVLFVEFALIRINLYCYLISRMLCVAWQLTSHHTNCINTIHTGHCWKSEVLLWTPTHGHTNIGQSAKTAIHHHSAGMRCHLEDLPRVMEIGIDGKQDPKQFVLLEYLDDVLWDVALNCSKLIFFWDQTILIVFVVFYHYRRFYHYRGILADAYCYVEECADTNPCGLNTDLLATNTTVGMDYATGVMWLDIENI